ncbi:MAG: hypothetical protein NTX55_02045 [Candidatus Parcubacteria bacterium]|nr:hypothetical protein [Candidatus Parcubacteria bacterium]
MIFFTEDNKPKQLKADTRQWSSGRVKFAVIGWKDKPDKNYIIFEKNFLGKVGYQDQKFNLHFKDWQNLKKLIDGDLVDITGWQKTINVADSESLKTLIEQDPDIFEKVLANPSILKLSESSFESLDRIAVKIYEIKAEKIDLIFKKISETASADLDKFSTLLNYLRLNQISMMTSLVYQKLKIIDLLEKIIINPKNKEADVHRVFENHPWLLGKNFDIVSSDKPLSEYLNTNLKDDPETLKRPDIIAKIVPYTQDVVIIELKAPGIKLKAEHIGQVLKYKALIQKHKPNTKNIHCFVYGYEKDMTFILSNDATIKTFSELISELRNEYREYQEVLEVGSEIPF